MTRPVDEITQLETSLSVRLCQRGIPVAELLSLRPGQLIEFPTPADAPVELCLGGTAIGEGQVVELPSGNLGLRVDRVLSTGFPPSVGPATPEGPSARSSAPTDGAEPELDAQ